MTLALYGTSESYQIASGLHNPELALREPVFTIAVSWSYSFRSRPDGNHWRHVCFVAAGMAGRLLYGTVRFTLCDTARALPERIAPWFFRCQQRAYR